MPMRTTIERFERSTLTPENVIGIRKASCRAEEDDCTHDCDCWIATVADGLARHTVAIAAKASNANFQFG